MADSPTTNHKPVFSLDTFGTLDFEIDGVSYDLARRDRFPTLELQAFNTDRKRITVLWERLDAGTLTPEQADELDRLSDRRTRQVLKAPDEVHVRLSTTQRLEILTVFWTPPVLTSKAGQGAAGNSIGASSSPSSSDSTAETRSAG